MTDSTLQAKNFFCILSRAARCIKAFLDVKACLLALKEAAWNSIGNVVKALSLETCNISVEPSEIIGTCGKLADEPWLRHGSACKKDQISFNQHISMSISEYQYQYQYQIISISHHIILNNHLICSSTLPSTPTVYKRYNYVYTKNVC